MLIEQATNRSRVDIWNTCRCVNPNGGCDIDGFYDFLGLGDNDIVALL